MSFGSFIAIIIIIAVHELFPGLSPSGHVVGFHFLLPCGWAGP